MGRVSRDARLLFVLLWTLADDEGRARGNPLVLAGALFPFDDDAKCLITQWLVELQDQKCIFQYSLEGNAYIQIVKWKEHQWLNHPSPSRLPAPTGTFQNFLESTSNYKPRARAQDLGPRTKDLGKKDAATQPVLNGSKVSEPNGSAASPLTEALWAMLRGHVEKGDPVDVVATPLDLKAELWRVGKRYLGQNGVEAKQAGSLLGKWRKQYGDHAVIDALAQAETSAASEPIAFVEASLRKRATNGNGNGHATTPVGKLFEGAARALARREREREANNRTDNDPAEPLLDG